MAAVNQAREVKVTIRNMEPGDEKTVLSLVWKLIYYQSAMDITADKALSFPVLGMSVGLGVLGFFQHFSLFQGFVIFLTLPSFLYMVVRFIMLPLTFWSSAGMVEGLYKFWSRNEIGRQIYVAEIDGAVVGSAAVNRLSATTCQIFRVAVQKGYQGRGIASQLMDTVLDHCRRSGVSHVVLITSYVQSAAHKLYEKKDFRRVNCRADGIPFMGLAYDLYIYHYSPRGVNPGVWSQYQAMDIIDQ